MSSKTIEQKVVEMSFDGRKFQSGIEDSMKSLDTMKKGFKFPEATAGFKSITTAAKNTDLSSINRSIDTVQLKFTALQVAATTAISNITSSAMRAGKNIVSMFTIDPIKMGLSEYETQINAVQTILANTSLEGTTLSQVNAALDELNLYADKTIYNFTEMTRNIGTFTAAGVKLDTSVSAIKGIANLAAVSGSTSIQASTAMYQLSQAMASGTVKLMDWNSVVNAGMGGKIFQEELKRTARNLGIGVDSYIEANGSFRDSLQEGWITTEVLTQTLAKFTGDLSAEQLKQMGYTEKQIEEILELGTMANEAATKVKTFTQLVSTLQEAAQSGWAQTWRILIGDFEEAKELYTEISNVLGGMIGASSDARNELLSGAFSSAWKQFMGEGMPDETFVIENLEQQLEANGHSVEELYEKYEDWNGILKAGLVSSDMLANTVNHLADETKGLSQEQLLNKGYTLEQAAALQEFQQQIAEGTANLDHFSQGFLFNSGRENIIEGVRNILVHISKIIGYVTDAWDAMFQGPTAKGIYDITKAFLDFSESLTINTGQMHDIINTSRGLFSVLRLVYDITSAILGLGLDILIKSLSALFDIFTTQVMGASGEMGQMLELFVDTFNATSGFTGAIEDINVKITEQIDAFKAWVDETGIVRDVMLDLGAVFSTMVGVLYGVGTHVFDFFSDFFAAITSSVAGMDINPIAQLFASIYDILINFFSGSEVTMDSITAVFNDMQNVVGTSIESMSDYMSTLANTGFTLLDTFAEFIGENFSKIAVVIMNIGVLKLVGAIGVFLASFQKLIGFFNAFTGMLIKLGNTISNSIKDMTKIIGRTATIGILILGIATIVMAIYMISNIPTGELIKAGITITLILAVLTGLTIALGKIKLDTGNLLKAVGAFFVIATVVVILAVAVKILASANPDNLMVAVASVIALMAAVVILIQVMGKVEISGKKAMINVGIMIVVVVALVILVGLVFVLSLAPWSSMETGLVGLVAVIIVLFVVMKVLSKIDASGSLGIVAIAATLYIMMYVLLTLGNLVLENVGSIIVGLVAAIGLIIMLSILMQFLNRTTAHALKGAVAIVVIVAAMYMFIGLILLLGFIDVTVLFKSLPALFFIILLIKALMIASHSAGQHAMQAGVMILAISIAINLLAMAIIVLSSLTVAQLVKGGSIIIAMMGVMMLLMYFSKYVEKVDFKSIIAIGVVILMLTGALFILTLLDTVKMYHGVVALTAVILATSVMFAALGLVKSGKKALAATISIALILAILTGALYILSGVPNPDGLVPIAIAISILVVALSISMIIMSGVTGIAVPALVGAIAMVAIMGVLGLVLVMVSNFSSDVSAVLKVSIALSIAVLSLATTCLILGAMGLAFPFIMAGILAFTLVIASLGLLMASIGYLADSNPRMEEFLHRSIPVLSLIGQGLGSFVGGIAAGLTDQLVAVAEGLSSFVDKLEPFLTATSSLDENALSGAKMLTEIILLMAAADFLTGLSDLIGMITGETSFEKLPDLLESLGVGAKAFSDATVGIKSAEHFRLVSEGLKYLAEGLNALPKEGGFMSWIEGDENYGGFLEALPGLAEGLVEFGEASHGIVLADINTGSDALKKVADAANTIGNSGGLQGFVFGDNDLGAFIMDLPAIGVKLKLLSNNVNGLSLDNIEMATNGLKMIIDVANDIGKSGGVWGDLAGDNNLGDFAEDMANMGKSLSVISSNGKNVNITDVQAYVEAVMSLASMSSSSILNEGHTEALTNMVNELLTVGYNFLNLDAAGIVTAATNFRLLVDSLVAATGIDLTNLELISTALAELGTDSIQVFVSQFQNSQGAIDIAMQALLTNFGLGVQTAAESIGVHLTLFLAAILLQFEAYKISFTESGKMLMITMLDAMVSPLMQKGYITTLDSFMADVMLMFNLNEAGFFTSGQNFIRGFANGMSSMGWVAREQAAAIGRMALASLRASLGEQSPSRETFASGINFILGFNNAVKSGMKSVHKTATNFGDTAKDALSKAISTASIALDDGIDNSPVIKPVLDLSDVTSGMTTLNTLFGANRAIGVNSNVERAKQAKLDSESSQNGSGGAVTKTVNFVQNNNSPKSLSSSEIYRQTKNQISQYKKEEENL